MFEVAVSVGVGGDTRVGGGVLVVGDKMGVREGAIDVAGTVVGCLVGFVFVGFDVAVLAGFGVELALGGWVAWLVGVTTLGCFGGTVSVGVTAACAVWTT